MQWTNSVIIRSGSARRLLTGQLLSQLFDRVTSLGLIWLMTTQFSPSATGWFIAVAGLPHLLISIPAVKWISRVGLVKTLVVSDLVRAGLYAGAALLTWRYGIFTSLSSFLTLTFLSNVAASLFNPAILSLPVHVVSEEDVPELTGLLAGCSSFAVVAGPLLAITLSQWVGLSALFGLTAVAYALAAFASMTVSPKIKPHGEPRMESEKDERGLAGALGVLRKYDLIRIMLLSFLAMNLLLGPVQMIFATYAGDVFGRALDGLAWMEGALGLGMVLGSFALSFVRLPAGTIRNIASLLMLSTLFYAGFSLSSNFAIARLCLVGFGFLLSLANVLIMALFQQHPDEADVPHIMAFVNLVSVAAIPLSLAVVSPLVTLISVRNLAIITSSLLVAVAAITFLRLRTLAKEPS